MKKKFLVPGTVIVIVGIVIFFRQQHPKLYTNDNATGMCTLWTDLKEDTSGFLVTGPFSKTANPSAPCPVTRLRVVINQ